jgi:hypothetical protein
MQSAQTVLSDQRFGAQVEGEQDTMWLEGLLPTVALRAVAPQCYELSTLTKPPNGIGRWNKKPCIVEHPCARR